MKIDTKKVLVDLSGKALKNGTEELTLGEAVANILATAKVGGAMKLYSMAQKFYSEDSIDLDTADLALLKSSVEATDIYLNLVKGQILVILNS